MLIKIQTKKLTIQTNKIALLILSKIYFLQEFNFSIKLGEKKVNGREEGKEEVYNMKWMNKERKGGEWNERGRSI